MAKYFGNKQFMRYQTLGFEQYTIRNAFKKKEEEFIKTVKVVPI